MTPSPDFLAGVRAGLAAAAKVAGAVKDGFVTRAIDIESDAVADQYAARAVGAQAVWAAISSIDPTTVAHTGCDHDEH